MKITMRFIIQLEKLTGDSMYITRALLLFLLSLFSSSLLSQVSSDVITYIDYSISINDRTHIVSIPKGYKLELLNSSLAKPRMLSFLPNKELLIGSKSGHIYRLLPPYRKFTSILKLDNYPHSIVYKNNTLFIAQTNGLYKVDYTPGQKSIDHSRLQLITSLPTGGHSSRTLGLGPDRKIYLSIGISGNCSNEYLHPSYEFEDRRGGIYVLDESALPLALKVFSSGLRNPVGFDWHPITNIMYASNNGPDHLGFELPPEYFSKITPNSFHGMPWYYYNGNDIKRDSCIKWNPPLPIDKVVHPVATFPARNAPMGVSFVSLKDLDGRFTYNAIVALRGSWGTPDKGSYAQRHASRRHPKLVMVKFMNDGATRVVDFITGFQLANGDRWARPVGTAIGPDHNLYFTSDSGINGLFRLSKSND